LTLLTADARRPAALFVAYIQSVCALLTPGRTGASTPSRINLFLIGSLAQVRDGVDLDADAFRERGDLNGGPGRGGGCEVAAVHLVDPGEVTEIRQEDRRPNHVIEAGVSGLQNGAETSHHPVGLRRDIPIDDFPRFRVKRDLTGNEQESTGANGLRIRTNRGRGVAAADNVAHNRLALRCFDNLV